MKKWIILAALLPMAVLVAQQPRPQGWGGTPEERAKRQTEMMKSELKLTDSQTAKADSINLKYNKEMATLREKFVDDRQGMREAMQSLREKQDAELKALLTPEQAKLWDEKVQSMFRRRPGGQPGQSLPPDKPVSPSQSVPPKPPSGNP
jgi:protein CpxP